MSGDAESTAPAPTRLLLAIRRLEALDRRRAQLVQERDAAILGLSECGLSFSQIATLCGLTRGRVGQIVQRGSTAAPTRATP